jgi:hypothetical protein
MDMVLSSVKEWFRSFPGGGIRAAEYPLRILARRG